MSDEKKVAELNELFPVEYPVIDGEVVGATAVSERELRYELWVKAPFDQVLAWHRETFPDRAFVLESEEPTERGGMALTYFRGGRIYAVEIVPANQGATRVLGTIRAPEADN
ncbi:MAG: hypothetical protein HY876_03365 [Coriobacteriales bacterium]|nr:hypothetical protein [Coriobacteriales bacterium]